MRSILFFLLLCFGTNAVQAAKFRLSGNTAARLTQADGNQIYYFDRSGKVYVWMSGKNTVSVGKWYFRPNETVSAIGKLCFKFGGDKSCEQFTIFLRWGTQRTAGDVFGLSKRKSVPFRLNRNRITFQQIAQRMGIKIKGQVHNTEDYIVRPGGQKLWGEPKAGAPLPPITCKSQLAKYSGNDRASKIAMAGIYFHGRVMGKKCVEVDYDKAFRLLSEAGDATKFRNLLDILRDRAKNGNYKAKKALAKWGKK